MRLDAWEHVREIETYSSARTQAANLPLSSAWGDLRNAVVRV